MTLILLMTDGSPETRTLPLAIAYKRPNDNRIVKM